jgi:MerR family transcriptional regulator, thiopeptide resistance regulator
MKTVSEVAELAGVSVRSLLHYEEIGLLAADARSEAGDWLYSHRDLERLQEILGWRELGFSLAEIGNLVGDLHYDRSGALRRQRALAKVQGERLASLTEALDRAIAAHDSGEPQEEATMFDGFNPADHEDESRERWGATPEYREAVRRMDRYGEAQWRVVGEEADAIAEEFAALKAAGADPAGPEAAALAERHRDHISRWFYDCTPEMHRALAELYVADPRFADHWDRVAPGLAAYVRDAIVAH